MGKPRHHAQDSARRASGNPWAQRRAARPRWYARSPPSCCPRRGRSRSLDTMWYQNPMWSKVTWESCPRSQPLLGTYDPTPPAHLRQAARPTAQSRLSPRRAVDFQSALGRAPGQANGTAVRRSPPLPPARHSGAVRSAPHVLDQPTAGLDPRSRLDLWDLKL